MKNKVNLTLKPEGMSVEAVIVYSREAHYGCVDGQLDKIVLASYLADSGASTYILSKKDYQRFTVYISELKTVMTGFVMAYEEMVEIIVTNVFPDSYEIDTKLEDIQRI